MWTDPLHALGSCAIGIGIAVWAVHRSQPDDRRPFGQRYHEDIGPDLLTALRAERKDWPCSDLRGYGSEEDR
ncbi:hypothetical protein ACGFNU_21675 [Spirillospora sp. NPDC048911]|uniref:hypothetical protein n=1 Tax=Spirillospora sp. NPDC048911 TaxID=3364527 RepID=UPI00371BDF83